MLKQKGLIFILTGVIILLAAGLVGTMLFLRSQPLAGRGVAPIVQISPMEPDSSIWGINFPKEYTTFLLTASNDIATTFGGSQPHSKLEKDPRLVKLFAGYSFSKDYNEERGHRNALKDVRATKRVNETTAGTCYSCKSSNNPKLWNEMGMADFDKTPFSKLGESISEPIGCANCHEVGSMNLIVTNPALDEALKKQGKDWRTFTRQEMRTVVCANCHDEYYFAGEGKYLTFPWEGGTRIENIAKYYDDLEFKDWDHEISKAPMIKMQHPEYEFYTADSTHYKAGVACADCHMPYTRDGSAKFSNHDIKSPLQMAEAACGTCHTDVTYVTERVKTIQQQVWEIQANTEDAIVEAMQAIANASQQPDSDSQLLEEARKLHREAQMRWDFVAAENSMGFHNPEEALRILANATNMARQSQIKALESIGQNGQKASLP
jgi:nitrite reductase (cytochrome c-552)